MEIQSMTMVLTEDDLNILIQKYLPVDQPIEDLHLTIENGGVGITGVYPLFINVQFETWWEIGIADNKICARLVRLKALGIPGDIFKSAIVKILENLARQESWLRFAGDSIYIDGDGCIAKYAFPARIHLKRIDCQRGQVAISAGSKVTTPAHLMSNSSETAPD